MIDRRWLAALAAAAVLALAGCGDDRGDPPRPARIPGLRWEQFPDIRFPPGWKPIPGEDAVAMAIGAGAVRRLSVSLQAPPARTDLDPDKAMSRYVAAELPDGGWVRSGTGKPGDLAQTWTRGAETLEVKAAREGGLPVLRYRLR